MKTKKTVVLGASENPQRYSNLAINRLKQHGHPIVAIGRKEGNVNGTPIEVGHPPVKDVDTITLYLNPQNQVPHYEYMLSLNPKRIIFNPGTENDELTQLANEKGIDTLEACTLVMLSTAQY
jgi:predicted CoA-binding protein